MIWFWPFLRLLQRFRVDALQADEHAIDAGPAGLLDEARDLVAHRVDLRDDLDAQALLLAHRDQAVEDRFPVLVAREVVVGDEEVVHALREVGADDALDVVGAARARLAPLHVDDGAEAAQERAAAPGVEARAQTAGAANDVDRQVRRRRALQARQIVHEVVERLELVAIGRAQQVVQPPFGFSGEQGDAQSPSPRAGPAACPAASRCSR